MRFSFKFLVLAALALNGAVFGGECDDDPTIAPFVKAVTIDKKNLDLQYNLAIAYYKKAVAVPTGQPNPCLQDAIDSFKRYTKSAVSQGYKGKEVADAYSVLGILYFQFGDDAKAGLDSFRKALELRPEDKESLYGAALACMKLEKLEEASNYFKKTIAVDPSNVNAAYNYATSINTMYGENPKPEQLEEIKKAFETVVRAGERKKKDSKDVLLVSYNRLAEIYGKGNEVPKAIEVLKKAIALEPNDFNAHGQLGILYGKDKNFLKMVEEYEAAIKINPDNELARYNLGVAYLNQEQAFKAYEQYAYIAEKINPSDSEILALKAQTLEKAIDELKAGGTSAIAADDYLTAKKNFEEVLKLNPKDKDADKYLDEASKRLESKFSEYVKAADKKAKSKTGNWRVEAAELYEKALSLKPDDEAVKAQRKKIGAENASLVKLYISQGDKALKMGDFLTAEEKFKQAMNFKEGKVKAGEKLKKLLDKFKGDYTRNLQKGQKSLKSKDYAAARTAFKAALSIKQNDREASAGLIQANQASSELVKKLTTQADAAADAGKKSEAVKTYNKILVLDPNNANAKERVKSLTGSESKVVADAGKVKELYYKGVDYYVNNNIKQAIATWEQLLKLDGNHEDAKKNILRAKTKLQALEKLKG